MSGSFSTEGLNGVKTCTLRIMGKNTENGPKFENNFLKK